ncbi:hypothetical protein EVAR_43820_1 [Eumeta japonica]|uniref:Uncharacterized protein n=1 Tax=Eumeta variegata TaxID=151549 RepID=A0A4C1WX77_EUMVA|nr:hypothetical protein EVAR_43820_1 [Eumeta japonica]
MNPYIRIVVNNGARIRGERGWESGVRADQRYRVTNNLFWSISGTGVRIFRYLRSKGINFQQQFIKGRSHKEYFEMKGKGWIRRRLAQDEDLPHDHKSPESSRISFKPFSSHYAVQLKRSGRDVVAFSRGCVTIATRFLSNVRTKQGLDTMRRKNVVSLRSVDFYERSHISTHKATYHHTTNSERSMNPSMFRASTVFAFRNRQYLDIEIGHKRREDVFGPHESYKGIARPTGPDNSLNASPTPCESCRVISQSLLRRALLVQYNARNFATLNWLRMI